MSKMFFLWFLAGFPGTDGSSLAAGVAADWTNYNPLPEIRGPGFSGEKKTGGSRYFCG